MALNDDIARIAEQERALIFSSFDENVAFRLGTWLREYALSNGWGIAIDIRSFDRPFFYAATAGASADNAGWARRKTNVVKHFQKSSYRVGLEFQARGMSIEERGDLPAADYAAKGGAFPIRVAGAGVIGAVAISGLPQRLDHETVVAALCALLGHDPAPLALDPEE